MASSPTLEVPTIEEPTEIQKISLESLYWTQELIKHVYFPSLTTA